MLRVTVWNEYRHEREDEPVIAIYPQGIHRVIAGFLNEAGMEAGTATLDEPEHGLTEEVLERTDVLVWWGHKAHKEVSDEIVDRVHRRVLQGMGLVVLHSGHMSKIFMKLMGTTCDLKWREAGERERLWVMNPGHEIAEGIGEYIELEQEEMYGAHFDVPAPDETIFIGWFEGGNVFPSGITYRRGSGKIFYFQPGHETHPTYYHPEIQRVIVNGVKWCRPAGRPYPVYGHSKELEPIKTKVLL